MDNTVSVGTLILVALLSGTAGALLSALVTLVNGTIQRKADRLAAASQRVADREAETLRIEAQMRELRVGRLRADLQGLVMTLLLMDRAADAVMNPANTTDVQSLLAEARAKYDEAVAGLVLDPDGDLLARLVAEISKDFIIMQITMNSQATLVQQRSPRAVDLAKSVDEQREQLHRSISELTTKARTVITKLTGSVPTLGLPEG